MEWSNTSITGEERTSAFHDFTKNLCKVSRHIMKGDIPNRIRSVEIYKQGKRRKHRKDIFWKVITNVK